MYTADKDRDRNSKAASRDDFRINILITRQPITRSRSEINENKIKLMKRENEVICHPARKSS